MKKTKIIVWEQAIRENLRIVVFNVITATNMTNN